MQEGRGRGHAEARLSPHGGQEHGQRGRARTSRHEGHRAPDPQRVRPLSHRQLGGPEGSLTQNGRTGTITVTIGRLNAETVLEGREKIGAPGGNRTPDPRLRSGSEEPVTDSYQVPPSDM